MVWVSNFEDLLYFRGEGTCFYERNPLNLQIVEYIRWKPSSTGSSSTDMVAVEILNRKVSCLVRCWSQDHNPSKSDVHGALRMRYNINR